MTFHSLHLSNLCRDLLTAVLDSGRNALQKSMAFLFSSANHGDIPRFSDIFEVNPLVAVWLIWKQSFWRRQNLREWAQRWTCWKNDDVNYKYIMKYYVKLICLLNIWNIVVFCFVLYMLCICLKALTDLASWRTIRGWRRSRRTDVDFPLERSIERVCDDVRVSRILCTSFAIQVNCKLHRYDRL